MKYYIFTEINDQEGKTWNFYLPISEEERNIISSLIESTDEFDSPYKISENTIDEKSVNILIENNIAGYMASHNKCLPLSDIFIDAMKEGLIDILENDPFYNGQCWDTTNVK